MRNEMEGEAEKCKNKPAARKIEKQVGKRGES
jgi:hypothetical protein